MMQFIRTTIVGGLIFLVPVVILLFVLEEAASLMLTAAEPLAELLDIDTIAGVATANIIAVLIVLVVCFLAGLLARTSPARAFADKIETAVLHKLPGYAMIKGVATSLSPEQQAEMLPVLVRLDDRKRVGLQVERISDSEAVVYFPGSPNAWAGTVEIVSSERIEFIDVPMTDVIDHAELIGRRSARLLSRIQNQKASSDTRNAE